MDTTLTAPSCHLQQTEETVTQKKTDEAEEAPYESVDVDRPVAFRGQFVRVLVFGRGRRHKAWAIGLCVGANRRRRGARGLGSGPGSARCVGAAGFVVE